jgi:hypothetical protein
MPRPRSAAVTILKAKLITRLRDGFHRPGQSFFSTRALSDRFGVSYQTAHRLLAELESEGWLERRPSAGTFVAGRRETWHGVDLWFADRARHPDSFGERLLTVLRDALNHQGVPHRVPWGGENMKASDLEPGWYPVIWELPKLAAGLAANHRYVLILEDRLGHGLAASYADSVSVDDYSGGVAAGEWLASQLPGTRCAVLAGPDDDARNRLRVAGFLSVHPRAKVVKADSWFFDEAVRAAPQVLNFAGVFCANDRLASAVIKAMEKRNSNKPLVVGFDDAPVSEKLDFTTIAIPWEDIASAAVDVARRRMTGDVRTAAALTFVPRPIVREGASTTT